MRRIGLQILALIVVWLSALQADDAASTLRVMTFNIRYGTAQDGENHWDRRKEFLVDTIKAFDPDLLGTQETLGFQRDYLAQHLRDYEFLGVGRDDGRESGEMMALYFRRERFEKLDGGHFWLSETPEKPGSKSWDSALPRMVTWVKLRDRKLASSDPFFFLNTHFDHLGIEARRESGHLIRRQITKMAAGMPLVLTGDFNAAENSAPYKALFDREGEELSPVIDAYRAVHPEKAAGEGTFSRFLPTPSVGPRIDWIGVSRHWEVLQVDIDRTSRGGRTASDHFAVTAVLKRKP